MVHWTPERDAELTADWESGAGTKDITAKFGASPDAIHKRVRKLNLSYRNRKGLAAFWTPSRNDEFRALWEAGEPVRRLGAHFGCSVTAILMQRLRLKLERRNKTPSWWLVPGRVERLKGLLATGISRSEIAMRLGCSRNAVCGKIARLGIGRDRPIGAPIEKKPKKRRERRSYAAAPHTPQIAIKTPRKKKPVAENKVDKERCLRLGHSKTSAPYRRFEALDRPHGEKSKAELRAELAQALYNTAVMQ